MPWWLAPIGAGYPDLLQHFAIYGIFAIGFNILFGLTGYLSFGHAAFLGVGSYATMWSFKLLTMNALPAVLFAMLLSGIAALAIGYVSLRRSGIYFSILTLAFAQMSYNLAYSVLTPITNGETGLRVVAAIRTSSTRCSAGRRARACRRRSSSASRWPAMSGFYFCAVVLIIGFFIAVRIFRSPFGMTLRGDQVQPEPARLSSASTRGPMRSPPSSSRACMPGWPGSLLVVTDPLAGAERMQWTASGEVVLMTILGGAGTLLGPLLGAGIIKYFENIFSAFNEQTLHQAFSFLPDSVQRFPGADRQPLRRRRLAAHPRRALHADRHLPARRDHGGRAPARAQHARQRTTDRRRRFNASNNRRSDGSHARTSSSMSPTCRKALAACTRCRDINLQIEEGMTHAIIGPNGAGKSTLLNVCVGRLKPDSGTVSLRRPNPDRPQAP